MINANEWEWFGNAAHFICGRWCRFHLATKVGKYLISTVGEYVSPRNSGDPCPQASALRQRDNIAYAPPCADEFLRIVGEVHPTFVVRENPAHVRRDAAWPGWRFATALRWMGYRAWAVRINACCCGADHERGRVWVLAALPDASEERLEGRIVNKTPEGLLASPLGRDRWTSAPRGCRGADGVANRVDRLKALGNGQVPLQAAIAFLLLVGGKS